MPAIDPVDRLRGRADQRPFIAGIAEDPPAFVARHLADRESSCSQAHITVDASISTGTAWCHPQSDRGPDGVQSMRTASSDRGR